MADGTDGRDHPSCPEFVEMTEYAGINLGLQPKILGKKRKEKKKKRVALVELESMKGRK